MNSNQETNDDITDIGSFNSGDLEKILHEEAGLSTEQLDRILSQDLDQVVQPEKSASSRPKTRSQTSSNRNLPTKRKMMQQMPDQTLNMHHQMAQSPYVTITEQPKCRGMRFRYECEGRSAGSIQGESSTDVHKTYPTIQINNIPQNVTSSIVVVSCVTKDEPPKPHPHNLVGKDCSKGVCTVKVKNNTCITFPNLGIQCVRKKDVLKSLDQRNEIRVDPYSTGFRHKNSSIDLNIVRLCFQVFLPDSAGKFNRIVKPVVSNAIYDKKAVNDLIICRCSRHSGSVQGGDEVFLLCEKVQKEDIMVRFYEQTVDGISWQAYAEFGQQDVHRQFAIVFKTPAYRDLSIKNAAQVYLQLERESDHEKSDPIPFQYIPDDPDPEGVENKRKRKRLNFDCFMSDAASMPKPSTVKFEPAMNNIKLPPTAPASIKDKLKQTVTRRQVKTEGSDTNQFAQMPQYSFDNTGGGPSTSYNVSHMGHTAGGNVAIAEMKTASPFNIPESATNYQQFEQAQEFQPQQSYQVEGNQESAQSLLDNLASGGRTEPQTYTVQLDENMDPSILNDPALLQYLNDMSTTGNSDSFNQYLGTIPDQPQQQVPDER